jgi:hypothetical protein
MALAGGDSAAAAVPGFFIFHSDFCIHFPAILPPRREKSAFATNAIFSRFPNENPENATF